MATVQEFADLVENDQHRRYQQTFQGSKDDLVTRACSTVVKPGPKYTKVDVGRSGKYMVVNETGQIFGIKAYGVIHRGHQYGTLETIHDWYWGEYTAIRRQGA